MKKETTGAEVFALLVSVPISVLLNGFALSTLWGWFVVPLGVKSIGYAHAIGLTILFAVFVSHLATSNDSWKIQGKERTAGEAIAISILAPLLSTFFGWVAHQCM